MRRHARLALITTAMLLVATACDLRFLQIPGSGPVRFRDLVFTNVSVTADRAYGSSINQQGQRITLLMDIYQPTGDTLARRPAIIWVHGGSFAFGSKASPEIVDQSRTFAQKGYVTAAINYRLNPGGCITVTAACLRAIVDAKHDAQAAVRYLRANAGSLRIDPDRIAIGGTSAGAITALNVGYSPDDPGTSGNPGWRSDVRGAVSLSGAAILTRPDPGEASALLFHGTEDRLVQYAAAQNTVNLAQGAGLTAYLTTFPGQGHVPYGGNRTEIINQTTNFLYWTLELDKL